MRLLEVECRDFRCLRHVCFCPGASITRIRGANAQGKTSLLEAVLYGATSKSHRTNLDGDLVRHGEDGFHVKLRGERDGREVLLEAHYWCGAKRFKVNGVAQTRVSDILGRLHVVFFSPEDVGLIKGGASARRRFLDMELSQMSPAYLLALQQYRQVLRQRNELLKRGKGDPDLLAVWDEQLVTAGVQVMAERAPFAESLASHAADAYHRIAAREPMRMAYKPDVAAGDFAAVLERNRASDMRRGVTQRGPHRDDLEISIDGRPARVFSSQGQQKTAALAVKLAEAALVRERAGEPPVIMLDEVLAELDARRASMLSRAIGEGAQCLLTTTVLERDADALGAEGTDFLMEDGGLAEA